LNSGVLVPLHSGIVSLLVQARLQSVQVGWLLMSLCFQGQFFKTCVGASWRLCSKLAPTRELMQQWRGSAALRRRQLFRRRENLFKKLASGADPTTFGNYNYNAGVVVG
jgi:hypothetical protein